jgi:beta-glucosidase/6-phospho-beta-glucosidase/beta-galactosidase
VIDRFRWATGIEDTFVVTERPGRRRLDEYELVQHYEYWRADIDLAASIGFDSMRYGIPWYRVEPQPGRFDWSFTDAAIPRLLEREIEPVIDLVHYGTPLWLEGEFANPDYPERVAAYAAAFAGRYRQVRWYTPLNEPFVTAELCGFTGRWPPHLHGDEGFTRLVGALARGVVLTHQAVKDVRPDALFVHVEATGWGLTDEPALRERLALDMERMHAVIELVRGGIHGRPELVRYLTANGMTEQDLEWFVGNAIGIDVLGLNYYPYMSVWRRRTEGGVLRQAGEWGGGEWLGRIVRAYHRRYGLPIFITECSINERAVPGSGFGVPAYAPAAEGRWRTLWLDEAVAAIRSLLAEGIPLVGFCWWPLFDLVNWEYREGRDPVERYLEPMGLVALRPEGDGRLRRERLPCMDRMAEIIASWPGT